MLCTLHDLPIMGIWPAELVLCYVLNEACQHLKVWMAASCQNVYQFQELANLSAFAMAGSDSPHVVRCYINTL